MAQQFEKLIDCLNFIEQLQGFGMQPTPELLAEKERLEALENVSADEYIFGTMKMHNQFMTPEKEQVVREMTDQLLSDAPNATQPCLLLGKVQCGKTDTFLSIMGMCFDRGVDIAVVMTKGTNTLTQQTIQRLNNDFRFFKDNHSYNQKVVITVYDILDLYKKGGLSDYQLSNPAYKFIIVVKKETTNLTYLNELWQDNETLRGKKVLVCDDEADFASRAYYKRKNELSLLKIAELIEDFTKLPAYCRYLQITATPYSLYLQPDGTVKLRDNEEASSWLPRYTGLVPIHSRYVGGRQYFELSEDENSMYSCLFQPVENICIDILAARNEWYLESNAHSENLNSLNYAVVCYLFAAAIRSIQVKKKSNKKYYSSCLIHCEISKKNHAWQEELITGIIEEIKNVFLNKGNADLHILDLESDAYESFKQSNELGNKYELINEPFPSFPEVEAEVKRILEYNDYTINVVNSEEPGKVATMLNEKGQLRLEQALNFFIGGSILDRGITIDNMLCFFYGRDPRKFQMDTVLQHARMYGARAKEDMACTRFFTTTDIYDVLKKINSIDSLMYDYLKGHRTSVQSDEFTSMVIGYDKRIKATAQNKYTPANTRVIKPKQRILPIAFQTGEDAEIKDTVKQIDQLVANCADFANVTEENPFFLMDYDTASHIIHLIASTFRYSKELENMDYEWDENEMQTALDHCTFGTDGMIYCLWRTDRKMSRERSKSKTNTIRWIDAPDDGRTDTAPSREIAVDRPVLMLLRQNGDEEQGWKNTPFYWPVFVVQQNAVSGIFTINGNKKHREGRKQFKLSTIDNYPKEEVLQLSIKRNFLFDIILGEQKEEFRLIKETTYSQFLLKDEKGNAVLADGVDPSKHYNLSSLNDGVFPFAIRDYKYLYLKSSQDYSGSQVLIKLDEEEPYDLRYRQGMQADVVYTDKNETLDRMDESVCDWGIFYHLSAILEQELTPTDQQALEDYKHELEELANQKSEEQE